MLQIHEDGNLNTFSVRLSDGLEFAEGIFFYQNLKGKVNALLDSKNPFLSITSFDIISKKYVAIADFKVVQSFDQIVGEPVKIPDEFFVSLGQNLKYLPNQTKLRGILRRNIPTLTRKRINDSFLSTPVAKRTRVGALEVEDNKYFNVINISNVFSNIDLEK